MTGQQIINICQAIIKRQDLNVDLLLTFINQQRKLVLRSNYLYKIQQWITGFTTTNGFVNTDGTNGTVKQVRYVEWNPDSEDNQVTNLDTNGIESRKKKLLKLNNIQEAFEIVNDVDAEGEPQYYVVMQGGIKIIPAPSYGVINIFGEWYPQDLQNTSASLNAEDKLNKEISDVIIFYACAEYFDFLEEYDKAQLWRNKGKVQLDEYLREIKKQMTDDVNLMRRDPFGNLGISHGWLKQSNNTTINVNSLPNADEVMY